MPQTLEQRLLLEAILQRWDDIDFAAEQIGIPSELLYQILDGEAPITDELREQLAKGLDVPVRALTQQRRPRFSVTILKHYDIARFMTLGVFLSVDRVKRMVAILTEQKAEDEARITGGRGG